MNHLIANGTHLYKKNSHLVRTPFTITLNPDERAYYAVAGAYDTNSWPKNGFLAQNTYTNVQGVGADLYNAVYHPVTNQHWRSVTTSHDPETCWYQGAYSTSVNSTSSAYHLQTCEAYYQIGAYHFTLPDIPSDISITSIVVKYKCSGAIICYQAAMQQGQGSMNNHLWKDDTDVTDHTMYIPTLVSDDLYAPSQLNNISYGDYGPDLAQLTGTPRGYRDIWGFTTTGYDGAISSFTTVPSVQYTMSSSAMGRAAQLGDFWLIPYIQFGSQQATPGYYPYYYPSSSASNGFWASCAVWGYTITVTIG